MATPKPGSILLGTRDSAALREWYIAALAPDHTGEGPLDLGGFLLVIEQREDVSTNNPEPGRSILNFHVDNFEALEAQLNDAGATWVSPAEDRASGRFATFSDPDGNYLQIIQFNEAP